MPEKICLNCKYFFIHMQERDVPLLVKHNPKLEGTFQPGQKLCVKRDVFVYKNETCGFFMGW